MLREPFNKTHIYNVVLTTAVNFRVLIPFSNRRRPVSHKVLAPLVSGNANDAN